MHGGRIQTRENRIRTDSASNASKSQISARMLVNRILVRRMLVNRKLVRRMLVNRKLVRRMLASGNVKW